MLTHRENTDHSSEQKKELTDTLVTFTVSDICNHAIRWQIGYRLLLITELFPF